MGYYNNNYSGGRGRGRWWVPVLALLFVGLVAAAVGASLYLGAGRAPYYGWWPWAPFGWFFLIPLFFFFAFFALRFFWWAPWGWGGWYRRADNATEVLRERFARGEITKEQFEEMRKELGGAGGD